MKAKLVKHESGYLLYDEDNITIGAEPNVLSSNIFSKLSIKNCQAIERGYDLDELAREFCHPGNGVRDNFQPVFKGIFIQGFQKALELMGDKKFSEEDINNAMNWIMTQYFEFYEQPTTGRREHYIQSLQQTEWDCIIEMEEIQEIYRDGTTKYERVPKLDADGCLILKLKSE